jgi:DNA polymerase-3 subunit epsilon
VRQIVLDTETTGLAAREGHRIIEIGALEIVGRRLTERRLHHYINPGRDSDEGALAVHGLTAEFLSDKPKFAEVAEELLAFVRDAEVIIHNASFDLEFLDEELKRLGRPAFAQHCTKVTDSLLLARELHPGKRNSLDALCERYGVSNRHRTLHGALLDAGLLADVYLAMTRGQDSLVIDLEAASATIDALPLDLSRLRILAASAAEAAAHEAVLDGIDEQCRGGAVWRRTLAPTS